jgi:hypothetical protein
LKSSVRRALSNLFRSGIKRDCIFFISVKDAEKLRKVNEACKKYKPKLKPLKAIRIIGRGDIPGYRPFSLRGREGRYIYILSEHFRQLKELNNAYKKLVPRKRRKKKRKKR